MRLAEQLLSAENSYFDIEKSYQFPSTWNKFSSIPIPKAFNESSIYEYLVSSCIILTNNNNDDDQCTDDEDPQPTVGSVSDFSTAKPLKRGKLYVDSGFVVEVEDSLNEKFFYCLQCRVRASYKDGKYYRVRIMINPQNGEILLGTCECKASAMGRCGHVAALLLLLNDYIVQETDVSCTSKPCSWNQGKKRTKTHKKLMKIFIKV